MSNIVRLITNDTKPNHSKLLRKAMENSTDVVVCVAFLKESGLSVIKNSLPNNATFYVGTSFYLTEPNALRWLVTNGFLVFACGYENGVFHPKVYYLKKSKNISIVTGSANLTNGGLSNNFEASLYIQTSPGSIIDNEYKKLFKIYEANSTIVSEFWIGRYESEFNKYWEKHKRAEKEFRSELNSSKRINLDELRAFREEYLIDGGQDHFHDRKKRYAAAIKLLDKIARERISSSTKFRIYYDQLASLFYSSGLLRGKNSFLIEYRLLIKLIKKVKSLRNNQPLDVFKIVMPIVKLIPGFGINGLTEIMNAYNPKKFSVANGRSLKSLAKLNMVHYKTVANNFSPDDYASYNKLIEEIALACGFVDLGQVDHFLSWYYNNYLK